MLIILFDQDVVTLSSFKIGRKGAKRTQIDTVFDVSNSYDETYDSIKPTARLTLLLHELIRREGRQNDKEVVVLYQSCLTLGARERQQNYERIADMLKLPVQLVKDCGDVPFSLEDKDVFEFYKENEHCIGERKQEMKETFMFSATITLLLIALGAIIYLAVFVINGGIFIKKGTDTSEMHLRIEPVSCCESAYSVSGNTSDGNQGIIAASDS